MAFDPTQARQQSVQLTPTAEQWGLEGTGCSLWFVPTPGPCTIAHFVQHADGWRMFVTGGELLDLDPLPINDVHAMVRVERPVTEFTELLVKAGVPHHAITVRGDVRRELHQLAELMGMPVVTIERSEEILSGSNRSDCRSRTTCKDDHSCPVKMMVLNQVRSSKTEGYGYGYGYGYGHDK